MSRRKVVILAATLILGLVVVATAFILRGDQSTTVTAQFEDTVGLYEGNEVSVLGMPVGKVTRIAPRDNYVEVTFAINRGVDIPADVRAVTVSTSILTDRHVELTPAYRGGPKLVNGDILDLSRTRTPVEFDRTLAMVDKLSRALNGDGQGQGPLADLIGIGASVASGNGQQLKATLDQLSQALRLSADQGARTKKDVQAIAANLAELTSAASGNDVAIREFGSNLRQLSEILADQNLGAGTTGAKVNQMLDEVASLLETNRSKFKNTAADARTITSAMTDFRRELAEFFDVAPLAIDNLYNAMDTNAGSFRVHGLIDKTLFNSQMAKELCNLIGDRQLGCATGTIQDYGPDFGLTSMLELLAGERK
ncbi:mammalian cell entry protein [Mycobacteroides chelonae]|uniref:Mammalian cell entry protein n=1 Tax=Mycobacteroides chelonae TaxID=1774 RepID=A0A1S1LY36_MYCCH|nr:MCE family protein [Mycobacteroides chelonae]OHU55724.1 mammalian cell entry protein [Mycobacteroides chelonae]OHU75840.1 mammalian cell entry protein [Mycobacteroides chelonae]PKQ58165.1 mammalian cell entry protein [Mycobacterium sp. MHSD3]